MKIKHIKKLRGFFLIIFFLASTGILSAQNDTQLPKLYDFSNSSTDAANMLRALQFQGDKPYSSVTRFDELSPLEQAFGKLSLLAAEAYATTLGNPVSGQDILNTLWDEYQNVKRPKYTAGIKGILAAVVAIKVKENSRDQSMIALKNWAAEVYRSIKVRTSEAVLTEYQRWSRSPCNYRADGYVVPPDCALQEQNYIDLLSAKRAPQNIIAKAALKKTWDVDADRLANVIGIGLSSVTLIASGAALSTTIGVPIFATSGTAVTVTALSSAFGAPIGVSGTTAAATTSAEIGVTGWASVVAAPVAAAILAVVVGTTEGFAVVEAMKVEPMLKMKLGAAMLENINIANVLTDQDAESMFYMGFMESADKGFRIVPPKVDGEVRFYCQAGYVSKFSLSYDADVSRSEYFKEYQNKEFNTEELPVGREETFKIPYGAKNIQVKGWYAAGDWKPIFDESLSKPSYYCYTSYGTVFDARYKTDCPEVGNMIAAPNELTVTQGGGYDAWVNLTYTLNGRTIVAQDQTGITIGWHKVYTIPDDATNIRLIIKDATGLVWDPWKTVIDKTWPEPPNECIKVYGTTLDPQWNNECN